MSMENTWKRETAAPSDVGAWGGGGVGGGGGGEEEGREGVERRRGRESLESDKGLF